MKRILLVALLSFVALPGFSQSEHNTAIGLYAGAGIATAHNYDVAPSAGFYFLKGVFSRGFLGADLFYQTYSLYYDNEQNSASHGTGISGATLRNKTSYVFIAPKFEYGFRNTECLKAYINVGVGFKVGGFDSLRKWDHHYSTTSANYYDSLLDNSKNLNSMMVRIGFGLKEYLHMGNHWWFTFTEDFGFITGSIIKSSVPETSGNNPYVPQRLSPGYISLQIGIGHTKFP